MLTKQYPIANKYLTRILRARVYDLAKETDLTEAHQLSLATVYNKSNRVLLKREDQQEIFSFKIRGAYNKLVNLTSEERKNGILAVSAGNHAQGVALAANHLGIDAKIIMPIGTPEIKLNAVKKFGNLNRIPCRKDELVDPIIKDGSIKVQKTVQDINLPICPVDTPIVQVILAGTNLEESFAYARILQKLEGRELIHPFDDKYVIAGQGTVGMEILKQTPNQSPDYIFVPIGGGGLISGIGAYIKAVKPDVKIIGVEPMDSDGMYQSLKTGKVIAKETVGFFADGVAVKVMGQENFKVCNEVVDSVIRVSTDEICAAIKDVFLDTRVLVEPSGALSVAGMKKYSNQQNLENKKLVCVISGANMDFDRLRFIAERSDRSERLIQLTIPEMPGAFQIMYNLIYPRNVTEFSYRIQAPSGPQSKAVIFLGFQAKSETDKEICIKGLQSQGYGVLPLENDEAMRLHGQFLSGGPSNITIAPNNLLILFIFPERPGALKEFLDQLDNRWNVTMFHYKNQGGDTGNVLVGFNVDPKTRTEFDSYLNKLKYEYSNVTDAESIKTIFAASKI